MTARRNKLLLMKGKESATRDREATFCFLSLMLFDKNKQKLP